MSYQDLSEAKTESAMADLESPIYSLKNSQKESIYNEIGKYFTSLFGSAPSFYVRVPGRINLIGEHIDYCGFSVLPMAIEQEVVLAVGPNDFNNIKIVNYDSDKYEKFSTTVHDLVIDPSFPHWYNYILCGYKGVAECYKLSQRGFNIVVKGTIPPSAGLSSSSALVCASALSVSYSNRLPMSKMDLAVLSAQAERFIGTEGGGMDQAIGFLAEPGTAKLIDFNPLKASNVPLPRGVAFVVTNSCVEMNKAASSEFNSRVVECKLAAKVISKIHELDWKNIEKLADIPSLLKKSLKEMDSVVESSLSEKKYSRLQICEILGINDDEFSSILSKNTSKLQNFKLAQRAKHVYQEADRVKKFILVCQGDKDDAIQELGMIMNESHKSCRDLYECSHPNLDELVKISLKAGAFGSRLTGAGWGGCCISLILESQVDAFMATVRQDYYEKNFKEFSKADIESAMFLTRPSGGAAIYLPEIL